MRIASLYFILFSQLLFKNLFAQQHYFFTNYTVDDGLSNNAVGCIIKDSEGYVWAGTYAGLNRFNGYDFTVYKSLASDSTTLPSNITLGFLVDHEGNLWIASEQGICLYDKSKNRFKRFYLTGQDKKKIFAFQCVQLFQDSKKNIWAATIENGLLKYNVKQQCFEKILEQLPGNAKVQVISMMEDDDGTFWMTGYSYLFHYNPSSNLYEEFENRIPGDDDMLQAMQVFPDSTDPDYLWIATWGSGLVRFNKQNGEYVSYKFQQNASRNLGNIVFNIHQHDKNNLWLATNTGVRVFDSGKKMFTGYVRDSINEKTVLNTEARSIYRDNEGITWIGTISGLCNIHPSKQNFVSEPLWNKPPVQKFFYDEGEEKIYGIRFYSDRALVIYDRKLNKEMEYRIPHADELRAEPFAIVKDNDGLIWIGTTKGIYTFNEHEKEFSLFEVEKQLHVPDRSIYAGSTYKDSEGNLWFSCNSKGLIKIEPKSKSVTAFFHDYKDKNSFPVYAIGRITEGAGKSIYMSDYFRGIVKMDNKKVTEYFNTEEKKYSILKSATDMAVDKEERIWATTKNNGLVCIDKSREATAFTKDDVGNIIDEQSSIALDDSGKVWLTASNGIYCFDPEEKSFTHFTMQDGLPVRTIGEQLHHLDNGKIAFLFYKGLFCFDPLNMSYANKPLYVHLTSLQVNGKISAYSHVIDRLDTITLKHSENNLAIEFAATDFANPSSVLYSYMLEGIDNHWSAPAPTRVVNFSQLPPGNFYLNIRAGNNSPGKKILIQIVPAWWQTTLFKWTVIIVIIGVSFFVIRFFISLRYRQQIARLEQQREIENIRARISRDIHDEIGSGLTKIKLISRNLSKAKEESATKEASSKISTASDELIKNLGEIVWTINPANDTLENIFAFVRNYISKWFEENSEIKLKLDFTEPEKIPHGIIINPEIKRHLLLILKESLTNIFKHSQATKVVVSLRADKSKIELNIHDNGKGMTTENQNSFGNGINNMRRRSESMNGLFTFESNGNGTVIQLSIPLSTERKIPT